MMGLLLKSFSTGVKFRLMLEPFSDTILRGRGYLHSYLLLINWINLSDDLSIYSSMSIVTSSRSNIGISMILNQPVSGSIIVMQVRIALFRMKLPPG